MSPCWRKNHLMWLVVVAFTFMNLWFHCSSPVSFSSFEANVFLRQFLFLEHAATPIIIPHGKSSPRSLNRSRIDQDIATKITHKSSGNSRNRKSRKRLAEKRIKISKASSKRRKKASVSHHGYYQVLLDSTITVGARTVSRLSVARGTPMLPARVLKLSASTTSSRRRQQQVACWSTIQGSI
jgi:hypothetical protein